MPKYRHRMLEYWKKRFQKTSEDDLMFVFMDAITLFDDAIENKKRIFGMCRSEVFKKIYREMGSPQYYKLYKPVSDCPIRIIDPTKTDQLYDRLTQTLQSGDLLTWNENKAEFYNNLMAERATVIDWICFQIHHQTIWDLVNIATRGKKLEDRQSALVKLVEQDSSFLTTPFAPKLIRFAEASNNIGFKLQLSQALNRSTKKQPIKSYRNRYALEILSGLGYYKKESYSEWEQFFVKFNIIYGHELNMPDELLFGKFDKADTIRKAIKRYRIPKNPLKMGRKSKNTNK